MTSDQTAYYFDENLRDVPTHPNALLEHIEKLQLEYKTFKNPIDHVRTMGELGVCLRQLMRLDQAENILKQALQLISHHLLGVKLETQQKIRLAHVYQWKKDFIRSTQMFSDIIHSCRNNSELNIYLAFALQHAGKNLFDQGQYTEALQYFNEALDLRLKNNSPADQINSTKLAIKVTRHKIKIKVNIRKAQSGDEEGLAKAHVQSWQEAYKNIVPQKYLDSLTNELQERIQNWTKTIVNPKRWLWVATVDDQIVGFVLFGLPRDANRDGYIELGAIYLLEKFKGLGIGFSLLNEGFNFMSTLGYKKSYCWVLKGNPTIKFYESTGAKFSGHSKTDDIGGKSFEELAYEWASISIENKTDLFSKQSELYFQYRPQYPNELFHYLAQISPGTKIVWDCACGNGQASVSLSKYFDEVIATDISSEQIRNCKQTSNVKYSVLRAEEKLPVEDHSLDLVTVAQAVHWFDLDVFYKEVARVLKPNGILAIWGYSFHHTSNSEMKRILDVSGC